MVKRYDDSVNEELRETVKLRKIVGSFSIPDPVSSHGHSRRKSVGTVGVTIHMKERDLVNSSETVAPPTKTMYSTVNRTGTNAEGKARQEEKSL